MMVSGVGLCGIVVGACFELNFFLRTRGSAGGLLRRMSGFTDTFSGVGPEGGVCEDAMSDDAERCLFEDQISKVEVNM